MKRNITIEIDTEHFIFFDNKLKIVVQEDAEIKIAPETGVYRGFSWTKPVSLGKISDFFKSMIESK